MALFHLRKEGKINEPFRLLLNSKVDYRFYLNKDVLAGYPVIYNEYEGGLYLGSEEFPYRFLIKAKDDEVTSIKVHPTCVLICGSAFHGHPKLEEVFVQSEEDLLIDSCAFQECPCLRDVAFACKKKVTLRYKAFKGNPSLASVAFDEVATYEFSSEAFAENPSLTEFEFPLGIAIDATQNRAYEVFKGTPIGHIYLPEAIYYVERWFESTTLVYCEKDPKGIYTDYEEETVVEPYYDYYHPGGTETIHHSKVGGKNFIGPISREEYRERFGK